LALAIDRKALPRPFLWLAAIQNFERTENFDWLGTKGSLRIGEDDRARNWADWPGAKSIEPSRRLGNRN
jgi:hypothetical protein